MKLHLFRQDSQDYQDFFGLEQQYPIHPVDPVKNDNSSAIKFPLRSNWTFFRPPTGLKRKSQSFWKIGSENRSY